VIPASRRPFLNSIRESTERRYCNPTHADIPTNRFEDEGPGTSDLQSPYPLDEVRHVLQLMWS
jgi:hypothetical protein